jgi:hypothetical protein
MKAAQVVLKIAPPVKMMKILKSVFIGVTIVICLDNQGVVTVCIVHLANARATVWGIHVIQKTGIYRAELTVVQGIRAIASMALATVSRNLVYVFIKVS